MFNTCDQYSPLNQGEYFAKINIGDIKQKIIHHQAVDLLMYLYKSVKTNSWVI